MSDNEVKGDELEQPFNEAILMTGIMCRGGLTGRRGTWHIFAYGRGQERAVCVCVCVCVCVSVSVSV